MLRYSSIEKTTRQGAGSPAGARTANTANTANRRRRTEDGEPKRRTQRTYGEHGEPAYIRRGENDMRTTGWA